MEDQNGPATPADNSESIDQGPTQELSPQDSAPLQDMLSEELKGNPSLKDFKDVNSLAKSYTHAQSMLGKSVRIPGEDAGQEQVDKFYDDLQKVPNVARLDNKDDVYNKLGRPESADKYQLDVDESQVDPNAINSFKQTAHQLGLNNQQLNEIVKFDTQRTQQQQEQAMEYAGKAEKALKDTWGNDFNNRLNGAKEAVKQYSEKFPDFAKDLTDGSNPMANNPIVIAALSELHKSMQEKGTVSPSSGIQYGTSADDAKEQISEIRGNKQHAYWDVGNPAHSQAVQKVNKLYQLAYTE